MLFRGKTEGGLYPFHMHDQIYSKIGRPFALVSVRVGASIWHSRLGHPASNTLSLLISNKCLPLYGNSSIQFVILVLWAKALSYHLVCQIQFPVFLWN
jgi:hypothetical protein